MTKSIYDVWKFLLIIIIQISIVQEKTNAQEILFESIQSENILDNQSILTITKDKYGKLWFGGKDKLFVYDSRTIKSYIENDSIFNNDVYINRIVADQRDNIIIGTDDGLFVYNQKSKKFITTNKDSLLNGQIYDIKLWKNNLAVAGQKGIHIFSFNNKSQKYLLEKTIENNSSRVIELQDNDSFLYASKNSIYRYTEANSKSNIEKIISLPKENESIRAICLKDRNIWAGTNTNGIYIISNNTILKHINESTSVLAHNNIRKILAYNDKIYVGTQKGLSIIDNDYDITNHAHQKDNPWSISQNSIYDIYKDDQQILWIGTYYGGLNAIFPRLLPIHALNSNVTSKYRLDSDVTSSYAEDNEYIYIGSDESGLSKINKKTKLTTKIATTSSLIKDLCLIGNDLYIAQHRGGITIYDTKSQRIKASIDLKNETRESVSTNKILTTLKGEIYVAADDGIYQLRNNSLSKISNQSFQSSVLASDKFSNVYTIFQGKLYIKTPIVKNFKEIKIAGIKNSLVNIIPTPTGKIYIATTNAIYELLNNKAYLVYERNNITIYNLFVFKNTLWIATSSGLIQYNINTKSDFLLNKYDGITTSNLSNANFFLSPDNLIYLCTLKGINVINPENLKFNMIIPSVMLNTIFVNDKEYSISNLTEKENSLKLTSTYDQNNITVDFSSSNFIKPQKNRYKYKLDGLDKEWKYSNYPIAKYMNLESGKYELIMYASNNDGIWSENPLIIDIEITPPFWKTWWAALLYIILFVAVLHLTIKFIVERQLLLNSEKEYEKKMQFFTQISHEIRTPLTLITVPIEDILHSTSSDKILNNKVKKLHNNANKLLNIVNELLDFKKIDSGKQALNKQEINFKNYIEETFYIFSELALSKNINYYINKLDIQHAYAIDTNQFDKVLYNLFSNALKYTPNNGSVYLEAYESKKHLIINIVDDGIGIDENNQFKIFEEFYRDPKAQEIIGTGIGLALTKTIVEQHEGKITCTSKTENGKTFTVFSINLPITKEITNSDDTIINSLTESNILEKTTSEKTILIVEDNIELSDTIASLFTDQFKIIKAFNGQEGIELATKYLPELIITDLMMPIMDGIEMVESLKKNFITSHIPIILLTADTNESSKISGLKFGANVYLEKPFNTSILSFTVNNLIQISSKNRKEFDIQKNNLSSEIDKKFIDKVENIINDNLLNTDFGVDFLSREIGVSQPILYKKLKSVTDLSVNNFIKQYRFKKAIELLETDKNISEVAYAVGFSDRKYFSREFKKQFGLNPSEYLEQFKNEN